MGPARDIRAFDERAGGYEHGWLGRLHHDIAERTTSLVLSVKPEPARILDVGCGTGYLLRLLAERCPGAVELRGIDPAPAMIGAATTAADGESRLTFQLGSAERLPLLNASVDLVVSTTSFDHWADQRVGLGECARVLVPGGHLVLVDLFSNWLALTQVGNRARKARTRRRATRLLRAAGFGPPAWHCVYARIINGVTTTR
jgi:ubiquinone/menaquinone biosynthesis C-methylase UbiE